MANKKEDKDEIKYIGQRCRKVREEKYLELLYNQGNIYPAWILLEENRNIPYKISSGEIELIKKQMGSLIKIAQKLK